MFWLEVMVMPSRLYEKFYVHTKNILLPPPEKNEKSIVVKGYLNIFISLKKFLYYFRNEELEYFSVFFLANKKVLMESHLF